MRKPPSSRVNAIRSSPDWAIGQPTRAPIAAASAMQRRMKPRTRGSSLMASVSAPVSAETGFIVMLPQSLYQTSRRTSVLASGLEAGHVERPAHGIDPGRVAAARFADDKPLAETVPDDARSRARARQVDDTARAPGAAAGVPGVGRRDRHSPAAPLPAGPPAGTTRARRSWLAEGPGRRIHQRFDRGGRCRQGGRLDGDDDEILHAELGRVARWQRSERFRIGLRPRASGHACGPARAWRRGRVQRPRARRERAGRR